MLLTDTQGHTKSMAMLNVWILGSLTFHKAHHYATYTTVVCVNVSDQSVDPAERILRYRNFIHFKIIPTSQVTVP